MTAEEFGQRPFAAGSLRGMRAFSVTTAGGLTGVVHKQPWTVDVNVAQCMKPTRPLEVYKAAGTWNWGCRLCNWVSPHHSRTVQTAYARATMHYDVAHTGIWQRSLS